MTSLTTNDPFFSYKVTHPTRVQSRAVPVRITVQTAIDSLDCILAISVIHNIILWALELDASLAVSYCVDRSLLPHEIKRY